MKEAAISDRKAVIARYREEHPCPVQAGLESKVGGPAEPMPEAWKEKAYGYLTHEHDGRCPDCAGITAEDLKLKCLDCGSEWTRPRIRTAVNLKFLGCPGCLGNVPCNHLDRVLNNPERTFAALAKDNPAEFGRLKEAFDHPKAVTSNQRCSSCIVPSGEGRRSDGWPLQAWCPVHERLVDVLSTQRLEKQARENPESRGLSCCPLCQQPCGCKTKGSGRVVKPENTLSAKSKEKGRPDFAKSYAAANQDADSCPECISIHHRGPHDLSCETHGLYRVASLVNALNDVSSCPGCRADDFAAQFPDIRIDRDHVQELLREGKALSRSGIRCFSTGCNFCSPDDVFFVRAENLAKRQSTCKCGGKGDLVDRNSHLSFVDENQARKLRPPWSPSTTVEILCPLCDKPHAVKAELAARKNPVTTGVCRRCSCNHSDLEAWAVVVLRHALKNVKVEWLFQRPTHADLVGWTIAKFDTEMTGDILITVGKSDQPTVRLIVYIDGYPTHFEPAGLKRDRARMKVYEDPSVQKSGWTAIRVRVRGKVGKDDPIESEPWASTVNGEWNDTASWDPVIEAVGQHVERFAKAHGKHCPDIIRRKRLPTGVEHWVAEMSEHGHLDERGRALRFFEERGTTAQDVHDRIRRGDSTTKDEAARLGVHYWTVSVRLRQAGFPLLAGGPSAERLPDGSMTADRARWHFENLNVEAEVVEFLVDRVNHCGYRARFVVEYLAAQDVHVTKWQVRDWLQALGASFWIGKPKRAEREAFESDLATQKSRPQD